MVDFCDGHRVSGSLAAQSQAVFGRSQAVSSKYGTYCSDHPLIVNLLLEVEKSVGFNGKTNFGSYNSGAIHPVYFKIWDAAYLHGTIATETWNFTLM